jgi:hypothetical protein
VWRAANPGEPFWFYQPQSFDEVLLSSEAAFMSQVLPSSKKPLASVVWYQVFDGDRVRTADVPRLLDGVTTVAARATALLNNTTLDASPVAALRTYSDAAGRSRPWWCSAGRARSPCCAVAARRARRSCSSISWKVC